MRRLSRYPLLSLLCAALAASGFAQGTTPQPEQQTAAEFQKLNGFFTFKRNRNAADYAITTPNAIHAPRKAFVPIEGGGHFAIFMKADAFLTALVRLVHPLTERP